MPRPFSDYTAQFFWNFKRMDNVNYNFEVVEALYAAKRANGNNTRFNKPILITLVSMIECMLYDVICRVQQHRYDPFPNIAQPVIDYFRGSSNTDEFKKIIARVESQNLLQIPAGDTLYEDLERLRVARNRLHIQNRYDLLARDEVNVFTDGRLSTAERCFERVCEVLANTYPRSNPPVQIPMADFPRPWTVA